MKAGVVGIIELGGRNGGNVTGERRRSLYSINIM